MVRMGPVRTVEATRSVYRYVPKRRSGGLVHYQIIGFASHQIARPEQRVIPPLYVVQVRRTARDMTAGRHHLRMRQPLTNAQRLRADTRVDARE